MDWTREKSKLKPEHFIIPLIAAVVLGYFLIFSFKVLKILGVLAIKYWYAFIIAFLIILFLRRKKKKKRQAEVKK